MPRTDADVVERIARVAHEVNRAYCAALGDNSQPTWEDAPEWQKASARHGVELHIDIPHITPEQSHEAWMEEKRLDGWKWGAVKDPVKKEHPCYVRYDQLPESQRAKDYIFKAIVNVLSPQENSNAPR